MLRGDAPLSGAIVVSYLTFLYQNYVSLTEYILENQFKNEEHSVENSFVKIIRNWT